MECGFTGNDPLDTDFDFAEYLSLCAAEMGEHILEIGTMSWCRVWLFALVLFAVQNVRFCVSVYEDE